MNNSEYWRNRASELENIQHSYSQEAYAEIEKIFINAQRETQKEIEAWYGRLAKNNQVSITEARKLLSANELAEFKWDVKEYIKYGKENAINKAWIKELENASAKYHISRLEALQIRTQQYVEKAFGNELDVVDTLIKKSYTDGYYCTMFDIQKGFNVGFDVSGVDERTLKNIVGKPWALDGKNFSDRIWASKQDIINELHSQLTRTCVLGKSPDWAINAISKKFDVSKNRARTLVQTEQAYFSSVAREDAFKELDVEEYEILATLDSRTSNVCQELDNKVFSMNDFEVGVTAPPFHPNCRSTTIPYFDDEYGVGKRAARGSDGKTYYVDSDMSYETWKKGFVDGDKSGIIESKEYNNPFIPAKTIKEAEDYARNILGIENVSYKGVDVELANEWNRGLKESFDKFPEIRENFDFVGTIQERNKYIKEKLYPKVSKAFMSEYPNYTLEQLNPHIKRYLDKVVPKIEPDTLAVSLNYEFGSGVTVNSKFKTRQNFETDLRRTVEAKFSPIGTDTVKSVLDHEIAHQLDNMLKISDIDSIQNLYNKYSEYELTNLLSTYAWKNNNPNKYGEFIAEGWSEYLNNENPREIAKEIGETIEREYEKWKNTSKKNF